LKDVPTSNSGHFITNHSNTCLFIADKVPNHYNFS
jgi:hypothetical protein